MLWGSDFLESERTITIGQSQKIWGNFSKNGMKINKNLKLFGKFEKNANVSENFLKFSGRE